MRLDYPPTFVNVFGFYGRLYGILVTLCLLHGFVFFYVHWLIFVCSNTPKHDLGNGGNVLKIQQEKQCGGTLMCSYSKGFTYVQNEWSISPNNLFLVVYTNSV